MPSNLLSELDDLISEGRNPRTDDFDALPTIELLKRMNAEDACVAEAVRAELPSIAITVDRIAAAFKNGGRLIYIGAGTSGRLGALDAAECPPTFGVPESMVVGLIAGGDPALRQSVEGAEDDMSTAIASLTEIELSDKDVVVGLAVSGRTPYVLSALEHANQVGATTVAVTCNPNSPVSKIAEIAISPVVGPEVLTGSTRLKSGTAQKLVLNMLSTASMVLIGKAYGNLMVDLRASNKKLAARAHRVVIQATGCSVDDAETALAAADMEVKPAIFSLLTGQSVSVARQRLAETGGVLRIALGQQAHHPSTQPN